MPEKEDTQALKWTMLQAMGELRRTILDESQNLNTKEVRTALSDFLSTLEAYVIDREKW